MFWIILFMKLIFSAPIDVRLCVQGVGVVSAIGEKPDPNVFTNKQSKFYFFLT